MLPIMAHFQWDPIWFGIMMTVNLAVGQVTPPVAVNLYVGANISGLSMEQISKSALPVPMGKARLRPWPPARSAPDTRHRSSAGR